MAEDIDEIALHVLLADSEIDPATAVAGSIFDEPQPPIPIRVTTSWCTIGIAIGGLSAILYFLLR
jgi:hypothetical protein